MTAHETTQRALAAIDAGDLDGVARALADRDKALQPASPVEQVTALADGAVLALRLAELKRSLAAEHARLEQLRDGLATYSAPSRSGCVDLRG